MVGQRTLIPRLTAIVAGAVLTAAAPVYALPISTFDVRGSGWVSVDRGVNQRPFDMTRTPLPNGGSKVEGGALLDIRNPGSQEVIVAMGLGSGIAFAEPGHLGVAVHGWAQSGSEVGDGDLGGRVLGGFSVASTEYLPIGGTPGTTVIFQPSFHIDGTSSSERPAPYNGPYTTHQWAGYNTGQLYFEFLAYTVNGQTLAYNNDAVGSGTYSFPNSLFTSIPTALDFGMTFTMAGRVGDFLVLFTRLAASVDDRAYDGYTVQRSDIGFEKTVNLYVDPVTQGLSFIANGHNYSSTSAPPPSVPEPITFSLIALGAGTWTIRRRVKN